MFASGHSDEDIADGWFVEEVSDVLGRFRSADGSTPCSWVAVKRSIWKNCFGNVRCKNRETLGYQRRLALLDSAVKP